MSSAREVACQVIMQVMDEGTMSHVALREALDKQTDMESRDRRFVTHLVQGTLENLYLLDAKINSYSKTPVKKMKPWIRALLRMSTYQLLFMENIPQSAVCNEAVKLAVKRKFQGLKGFVNGVLRSISRDPSLPEGDLSLRYSMPQWLVDQWIRRFGEAETENILKAMGEKKELTVRCNLSKAPVEEILTELTAEGVTAHPVAYIKNGYTLTGFESIDKIKAFRKGWIQVQDVSSMLAAEAAAPLPGSKVLDVCAAPGGKTMHLADQVGPDGSVIACDLTEGKAAMIRENRDRSGFDHVEVRVQDARVFVPEWEGMMDLVMADLPCSGIGTIGHKPEIRYRVTPESVAELAALQREILDNVWRYVKPGGVLIYSTCTMASEENEENYRWFIRNHPFEAESLNSSLPEELRTETTANGYLQMIPGRHPGCDGFFISRCRRNL